MAGYEGDIRLGDTIDVKFTTVNTSGVPTTLAGTPVISAYVGNGTTQITAGITLSVDFDGVTGLHNVRVVASSGNGYAAQTNVTLVVTTGTVGGSSVVGYTVGSFSIENRSALRPTTAGRTLDVSAGGEAGLDWSNIGSPTTAQNLSGTNIDVDQVVASVSGAVGSVTGAVGSVTGAVGSVTGNVGGTVNGLTATAQGNVRTAVGLASANLDTQLADLPTNAELASEIDAVQADIAALNNLSATEVEDAVWDATLADHLDSGSTGAALNAAGAAGDPWSTTLPGAYGAGTAGNIIGNNLDATVSSRATQTSVDDLPTNTELAAETAALAADIAGVQSTADAIEADTQNIQTRLPAALDSGRMDSSVGAYQTGLTPLQPTTAGRTLDVTAAGNAGIDWGNVENPTTAINLSGTNIDTDQVVASVTGAVGSVTGAVGSVTGNVGGTVNGLTATAQGNVRTAVGLATNNLDTQLGAIQTTADNIEADTQNLQSRTPAALVGGRMDSNLGAINNTVVAGDGAGTPWGP